jgi:hypothetical protein
MLNNIHRDRRRALHIALRANLPMAIIVLYARRVLLALQMQLHAAFALPIHFQGRGLPRALPVSLELPLIP